MKFLILTILIFSGFTSVDAQSGNIFFKEKLKESPDALISTAVKNTDGLLQKILADKSVKVRSVTPEFIYLRATPKWLDEAKRSGFIDWFHYEYSLPTALLDTSRAAHFVNQVHAGEMGLQTPFTGKNVIIGYVDQGLDYTHPDFIDENGQTRVLYYWDHTLPNAANTPAEYGYGQLWTAAEIQAGTCGSTEESSAHGTSVTGSGSGNGRANGENKGIAPDSKIIVVETNFNLPNWTLTVADACDFIFAKAAELGLPAVVNLSVGSYLGSHDGDDPASVLMEQLVETPGRIIVCAAGNSGSIGKYHVHNDINAATSFVWLRNNPSGPVGPNTAYFDLWTDVTESNWQYAIASNLNSADYAQRGSTIFRNANFAAGSSYRDTVWAGSNRLATIEVYPEIVGAALHLEVVWTNVDSTDYNLSFLTNGTGSYDLWSGAGLGLNQIVSNVPSAAVYPAIVNYVQPDTLQTIVSSWNCSEKIISVGNVTNRYGHYDKDNVYHPGSPPGRISPGSSKGPNRRNIQKPDITAGGDGSLAAGPMWVITNPAYNSVVDIGGWHVRNGGTSMASPVVAGVAALYLEKCSKGTYASFKNDLITSAFSDAFTGTLPNYAYGNGKVHALNLLLQSNYAVELSTPTQVCGTDTIQLNSAETLTEVNWSNETTGNYTIVTEPGDYFAIAQNVLGCVSYSDTVSLNAADVPPVPVITKVDDVLSTAAYPVLQWFHNDVAISGATGSSITISLPVTGDYTVTATGAQGCESTSDIYNAFVGINELSGHYAFGYPNPVNDLFMIDTDLETGSWEIADFTGKIVSKGTGVSGGIDVSQLSSGSYYVKIASSGGDLRLKFVKN